MGGVPASKRCGHHLAAAHVRRQLLQPLALAVEHADAGRAIGLVAGEDVEVGVQIPHVHRQVHRRLRAVHQHRNAVVVSDADDVAHRRDGAERIGHVGHGDDLRARRDHALEFLDDQLAVVVHRNPFQHRTGAFAVKVPRDDVGMMLQQRHDDLVAFADELQTEAGGHQIEGFRGVARENDLVHRAGVEKAADGLPRRLETVGGQVRQKMQAPVDVGIFFRIGPRDGVDDHLRFLGRRAIVQIDQRFAVHLPREDGEIGADALHVIGPSSMSFSSAASSALLAKVLPPPPPKKMPDGCKRRGP